jgi:hypothetical protein
VDVQDRAIAAEELDDRQSDRIGTPWRACGENAVWDFFPGRRAEQIVAIRSIEDPENEQVGEAFDVFQPFLEFGKDLERAVRFVFCAWTLRDLRGVFEGSSGEADGGEDDFRSS